MFAGSLAFAKPWATITAYSAIFNSVRDLGYSRVSVAHIGVSLP
jgi:hypothetical protein